MGMRGRVGVHGRGACITGGVHGRGRGHALQERRPLQQMVRILLECILVANIVTLELQQKVSLQSRPSVGEQMIINFP